MRGDTVAIGMAGVLLACQPVAHGTEVPGSIGLSPSMLAPGEPGPTDDLGAYVAGEIVVKLTPGHGVCRGASGLDAISGLSTAGRQDMSALFEAWDVVAVEPGHDGECLNEPVARTLGLDRYAILRIAPEASVRDFAAACAEHVAVFESVELNPIGHAADLDINDPLFRDQWALENVGQTVNGVSGESGVDVGAYGAWAFTAGEGVIVAVLDTGVSYSHPDLQGQLLTRTVIGENGQPQQVVVGRNWTAVPTNDNADDNMASAHGTKCAGILAAAAGNGIGMAGLAPGVKIMPCRVLGNSASGSPISGGNALRWATDQGAKVISLSLGYTEGSQFLLDSVRYAVMNDVVVVAATGNVPSLPVTFPAQWDEVIAVGATDAFDRLASFTAIGTTGQMDICAPGVSILTTIDTGAAPNSYGFESGTSMATPMVAAAAAMVRAVAPTFTAAQTRQVLLDSADDLGAPGRDLVFGAGRLNVGRAVVMARGIVNPCPTDFDGNGLVTLDDLLEFFDSWSSTGLDYDQDGESDLEDLLTFFDEWTRGC